MHFLLFSVWTVQNLTPSSSLIQLILASKSYFSVFEVTDLLNKIELQSNVTDTEFQILTVSYWKTFFENGFSCGKGPWIICHTQSFRQYSWGVVLLVVGVSYFWLFLLLIITSEEECSKWHFIAKKAFKKQKLKCLQKSFSFDWFLV